MYDYKQKEGKKEKSHVWDTFPSISWSWMSLQAYSMAFHLAGKQNSRIPGLN